jgi:hypothetical protein
MKGFLQLDLRSLADLLCVFEEDKEALLVYIWLLALTPRDGVLTNHFRQLAHKAGLTGVAQLQPILDRLAVKRYKNQVLISLDNGPRGVPVVRVKLLPGIIILRGAGKGDSAVEERPLATLAPIAAEASSEFSGTVAESPSEIGFGFEDASSEAEPAPNAFSQVDFGNETPLAEDVLEPNDDSSESDYPNIPSEPEPLSLEGLPEYIEDQEVEPGAEPDWQNLPPSDLASEKNSRRPKLPPGEQKAWDESFLFGHGPQTSGRLSHRTQTLLENIQIQKDNLNAESPAALKQLQFLLNSLAANAPEGKLSLSQQLKLFEIALSLLAEYGEKLLVDGLIACIARPELDPSSAVPYLRGCVKNAYIDRTIRPGEKRLGRQPPPPPKTTKSMAPVDDF